MSGVLRLQRCKRGWRMQVLSGSWLQTDTTLILRPLAKQCVRLASFFAINTPAAMCSQPVSMHDNILRSICKNSEPRLVYRTTARQLALHRTTM